MTLTWFFCNAMVSLLPMVSCTTSKKMVAFIVLQLSYTKCQQLVILRAVHSPHATAWVQLLVKYNHNIQLTCMQQCHHHGKNIDVFTACLRRGGKGNVHDNCSSEGLVLCVVHNTVHVQMLG